MIDPTNPGDRPDPMDRATGADEASAPGARPDSPLDSETPAGVGGAEAEAAQAEGPQAPAESGEELDMSAFEEDVEDSELAKALSKTVELEDRLARAHADLYNLNQEYSNYVRRSKEAAPAHRESGQSEVLEALIGVLDDIDAARAHGDLEDGPFASIAVKLESVLAQRFSLERFGAEGEDFDPEFHEALLANTNPEVDRPIIAKILQPGYRRGEKILRAAKVMVDNPE